MRVILAAAMLALLSSAALAGNCNYPDDRAADNSRCGDRAASERPGGK